MGWKYPCFGCLEKIQRFAKLFEHPLSINVERWACWLWPARVWAPTLTATWDDRGVQSSFVKRCLENIFRKKRLATHAAVHKVCLDRAPPRFKQPWHLDFNTDSMGRGVGLQTLVGLEDGLNFYRTIDINKSVHIVCPSLYLKFVIGYPLFFFYTTSFF